MVTALSDTAYDSRAAIRGVLPRRVRKVAHDINERISHVVHPHHHHEQARPKPKPSGSKLGKLGLPPPAAQPGTPGGPSASGKPAPPKQTAPQGVAPMLPGLSAARTNDDTVSGASAPAAVKAPTASTEPVGGTAPQTNGTHDGAAKHVNGAADAAPVVAAVAVRGSSRESGAEEGLLPQLSNRITKMFLAMAPSDAFTPGMRDAEHNGPMAAILENSAGSDDALTPQAAGPSSATPATTSADVQTRRGSVDGVVPRPTQLAAATASLDA